MEIEERGTKRSKSETIKDENVFDITLYETFDSYFKTILLFKSIDPKTKELTIQWTPPDDVTDIMQVRFEVSEKRGKDPKQVAYTFRSTPSIEIRGCLIKFTIQLNFATLKSVMKWDFVRSQKSTVKYVESRYKDLDLKFDVVTDNLECSIGGRKKSGKRILSFLNAIGDFLRADEVQLVDESKVICAINKTQMSLKLFKYFSTGKTWYESHGFQIDTRHDEGKAEKTKLDFLGSFPSSKLAYLQYIYEEEPKIPVKFKHENSTVGELWAWIATYRCDLLPLLQAIVRKEEALRRILDDFEIYGTELKHWKKLKEK
jgi:hypothetical protein